MGRKGDVGLGVHKLLNEMVGRESCFPDPSPSSGEKSTLYPQSWPDNSLPRAIKSRNMMEEDPEPSLRNKRSKDLPTSGRQL